MVAAFPFEFLPLIAAVTGVFAWALGGVVGKRKRSFSTSSDDIRVTKTFTLPAGAIGPDGHLDDETKAKLAAAGLDPRQVERELASMEPGDGVAKTVLDVNLGGSVLDAATREQVRKELDERLDELGIDHAELDARLEKGEDHIRIEGESAALLPDGIGELKPGEVETVVNVDIEGEAMDPRSRAKLDEELDKLGIDRTEIDEKLDRGETHIHIEHDSPS